jgi:hypothetical protein
MPFCMKHLLINVNPSLRDMEYRLHALISRFYHISIEKARNICVCIFLSQSDRCSRHIYFRKNLVKICYCTLQTCNIHHSPEQDCNGYDSKANSTHSECDFQSSFRYTSMSCRVRDTFT